MQFTNNFKHIIFLKLILLISVCLNAQETDSLIPIISSDTTEFEEVKKKFRFSNLFKKKDKSGDEFPDEETIEEENISDTVEDLRPKKRFFSFFKKKVKNDSIISDSINTDSSQNKKRFVLFKKKVKDSTNSESVSTKPQRISLLTWNKMDYSEQDSLLRAWDDYDKDVLKRKKRYSFTRKEIDIALKLKKNRNIFERFIYRRARSKPFKLRKKLITNKNSRYTKTLLFDRMNKSNEASSDTLSEARKYEIVNKKYKIEAKKEAIRKNKVVIKFERKEDRLRRKYELSGEEKKALNKGRGMPLRGTELILFNKAKKKQEKFSEKLLKLRRKRILKLQNEEVRKRMKQKRKKSNRREDGLFNNLFNKWNRKSEKHDSHEYPKRYHK